MLIRSLAVVAGLILGSAAVGPMAAGERAHRLMAAQLASAGEPAYRSMAAGEPGYRSTVAAEAAHRSIAAQLARDFQSAWRITRGNGATVAVLSSGVDSGVSSLHGTVTQGPDFARFGTPHKLEGTLVASMIAGSGPSYGSPFGIRGLAPGTRILAVRVYPDLRDQGSKQFFASVKMEKALGKGIRYATRHGADVIYIDEWTHGTDDYLDAAVTYALSKGVVLVASVGPAARGFSFGPPYPAGIPGVIGVGAVDLNGHRMKQYSGRTAVLVSAPGVKIPGIGPGNQPYVWWGDPVATTWVASAAALIKSRFPHLSPALVARAIASSARRHPPGGYNRAVGFGIINPGGALAKADTLAKLTAAAQSNQGAVSPSRHFGGGPPADIDAVRHNAPRLAAFAAVTVAGFACLMLAGVLVFRRRRRRALAIATALTAPAALTAATTPIPFYADPAARFPESGWPGHLPPRAGEHGWPGYRSPLTGGTEGTGGVAGTGGTEDPGGTGGFGAP